MEQRPLGHTGKNVSSIGLGGMSFSDFYGKTSREESFAVMDLALELGINHIDTSNIYGMGRSETVIGEFLKAHGGESPFVIATKAGITSDPETGARCYDNSEAHLRRELEGSLKRLGLEQVDLFYIHRRDTRIPIEDVTHTLVTLKQEGKIGGFGFSEIAPYSLRQAADIHPVDAVQNEYSLSTRLPEMGLNQECARQGTAMVAFSPVGRGLLTDTPPDATRAAGNPFLGSNPRFVGANLDRNLKAAAAFAALAAEMGYSTAGLANGWVLAQGQHILSIPGTRSVDHLRQLAQGATMTLSPSDMARIEEVLPVGWAAGDRYSEAQNIGPERYS
ncbi:aldo/keto reductase [Donghicola mangrovi]|uniref:Aldo/keto reductase n=1 Tax=Donghicola mangrovi TaxID=2729614 RepID=A0A850Q5D3_9RHOB|nr:aldo/keto reductase [Donghicola mangrovi]NVO24326.1 aldo/keto reductase [Donghicola mangrovi]